MRRLGKALVLGIVCWAIALAQPAAATAPESIEVSLSPGTVSWPDQPSFTYEVRITAGPGGAEAGLNYWGPRWPGFGTFQWNGPLAYGEPRLVGVGTIRPAAPLPAPAILIRGGCTRGAPSDTYYPWVELPPDTESTVEIPVSLSALPWPGTNYTTTMSTFYFDSAIAPRILVPAPAPTVTGQTGVRIDMRTTGPRRLGFYKRHGLTPPVAGTTTPALANALVRLRAAPGTFPLLEQSWGAKGSFKVGRVRTNKQGGFRLGPAESPKQGRYVFIARSHETKASPADWNCGPLFTVAAAQ